MKLRVGGKYNWEKKECENLIYLKKEIYWLEGPYTGKYFLKVSEAAWSELDGPFWTESKYWTDQNCE